MLSLRLSDLVLGEALRQLLELLHHVPFELPQLYFQDAAGLVETLQGEGPFTVFAPTDEAFAALPDGVVEMVMMEENQAQLQTILTCHVVADSAMSDAIMGMIEDDGGAYPVETVGGCTLMARMDGDMITLEDENGRVATVTVADVRQSNGVIHVIDTVLLPAN